MNIRIITSSALIAALAAVSASQVRASEQAAAPISVVAPAYSAELRHNDIEGEVLVKFTISKTGDVVNPEVVRSSSHYLEYPTLEAVRQWKFTPAMKDGVAVSVVAEQPIAFVITDRPGEAPRMVTSKQAKAAASLN